ncbi:Asp23/Gls24 family envelope stress response protein [Bacillus sp. FJAT-45350]|uniref:Asp23/Gls24 family envelope stress response protein n=1 Tax=Bacillus sp. FJAT-45350 TaxID=2011014 RepID=UPI0015CCD0F4|nr:Asp23/Gls24 family envelope stress response protein [Bacillus sp. FJAT-45350]
MNKLMLSGGELVIARDVMIDLVLHSLSFFSPYVKPFAPLVKNIVNIHNKTVKNGVELQTVENEGFKLYLHLSFLYGEDIALRSFQIQNQIKKDLEDMTGLSIREVNITVERVHFD